MILILYHFYYKKLFLFWLQFMCRCYTNLDVLGLPLCLLNPTHPF